MMYRILPLILLLSACAPQTKAAKTIAPLINENTFLVIRLDLEKIDFAQISEKVQEYFANPGTFSVDPMRLGVTSEEFKILFEPLQELNDTLRKEVKAKELYIISSTDYFAHQIPCVVAVPLPNEKPETVKTLDNLFAQTTIVNMQFAVRFARHGFYFAVPSPNYDDNSGWSRDPVERMVERMVESQKEGMRQLYRTTSTQAKPEVGEAFAELAGNPIQILLMRVPMFTAVVSMIPWEQIPFFQTEDDSEAAEYDAESADPFADEKNADPFSDDTGDSLVAKVRYELREGISWLAWGLDPIQERTKWVIKSKGQGGAKRTAETLAALVELLSGWIIEDAKYRYGNQFGQWFESKEELHTIFTLFSPKPVPQKEVLSITIDPAFTKTHAALLEPFEKRMQELFGMPKRMQTANQLKQIGLAVHNYHDVFNRLPSASGFLHGPPPAEGQERPIHSWRVHLLPFVEETALYDQIINNNEPWDGERNKLLHARMPKVYANPALSAEDIKKGLTNYVFITGEKGPFPGPNREDTLAYFRDGTSNQIMAVESAVPVCWMDPAGDMDFDIAKQGINKVKNGIGIPGQGGAHVLFGDGRVQFLPESTAPAIIEALINPNSGQAVAIPRAGSDTRPERPERPRKIPKPGRATTVNNLKQLAIAMHNYHDARAEFPSVYTENEEIKLKPLHSWRVAMLPFVEEQALYSSIRHDEPWDSEWNKQFHDKMPAVFISTGLTPEEIAKGHTTFAVVWGEKTVFQPGKRLNFGHIPDGSSNTAMIFQRKTSFCWMDPTADIPFAVAVKGLGKDDKGIGVADTNPSGKKGTYCAAFDAAVRFLPENFDVEFLEAIINPNDGLSVPFP